MKSKTHDYLHLYLTQTAIVKYHDGACPKDFEDGTWWITGEIIHHAGCDFIKEIKLILRPLSDITEEESIFVHDMQFPELSYHRKEGKSVYVKNAYLFSAPAFHYLLKQGFDLFGLIDAGLAIDKTKMK